MKKLGTVDANFLYTETQQTPNHVASVQLFQLPSDTNSRDYIAGLKKFYQSRIHLVPYLTRKLRLMPGNIDHPVWVNAVDFDIDDHIVEITMPTPASFAQLEAKIAELHAELMDRNKPMWMLYVLTGFNNNQVAFYSQAHHACIDGMAGQAATMILMDTSPDHPIIPPPAPTPAEDESLSEMYRLSFQNFLDYQLGTANRWLGGLDSAARLTALAMDPSKQLLLSSMPAPDTRFNRMIGKQRAFAMADMSVSDLKAMGKKANCKLNDIFMAICAGGLRRYMQRANDLPKRSLKAGCPVSLRKPGDTNMDNQVTMMTVALSTDIRDPLLRLKAIIKASKLGKEVVQASSAAFDPNVSLFGLPTAITNGSRIAEMWNWGNSSAAPTNLIISNVPGPRETLYSNRARMLTHYPASIPTHNQGLNITATSYIGTLYFSITACAKAVPDAAELRDDIMTAYVELMSLLIPNPNKVTELQDREVKKIRPAIKKKPTLEADFAGLAQVS